MRNSILIIFCILCLYNCNKDENNNGNSNEPLKFESLIPNRDTIFAGDTTKIIATATGYNLSYNWSATSGDILGQGAEVIYTASPCQIGKNTIECEVKDGNENSEKKEVTIVVE